MHNVFIPHIHADDDLLPKLRELAERAGCTVRDSSINSSNPNNATDPDYIKREYLKPGIEWAGTVVVLITPSTKESDWVNWEIEYAQSLGKRIVGIYAHGAADCDVPDALEKYADAIVGWQSQRVADAISGECNNWESATGEIRPDRTLTRYSC